MHLYRIDFYMKSFFYGKPDIFRSVEMFKKNLNAHGDFIPAASVPQKMR